MTLGLLLDSGLEKLLLDLDANIQHPIRVRGRLSQRVRGEVVPSYQKPIIQDQLWSVTGFLPESQEFILHRWMSKASVLTLTNTITGWNGTGRILPDPNYAEGRVWKDGSWWLQVSFTLVMETLLQALPGDVPLEIWDRASDPPPAEEASIAFLSAGGSSEERPRRVFDRDRVVFLAGGGFSFQIWPLTVADAATAFSSAQGTSRDNIYQLIQQFGTVELAGGGSSGSAARSRAAAFAAGGGFSAEEYIGIVFQFATATLTAWGSANNRVRSRGLVTLSSWGSGEDELVIPQLGDSSTVYLAGDGSSIDAYLFFECPVVCGSARRGLTASFTQLYLGPAYPP